jgi:endonuclease YncB( thermonuclease family)
MRSKYRSCTLKMNVCLGVIFYTVFYKTMGNSYSYNSLSKRTTENTPEYGFAGQIMMGNVTSVYDGDTFRAAVHINGKYCIIKVRCFGYDSPEMRPPKSIPDADRQVIVSKALAAKTALAELILNKVVNMEIQGFDKYGRFLARVWAPDLPPNAWVSPAFRVGCCCMRISYRDVCTYMIERGHGVAYVGGTKGVAVPLEKVLPEEVEQNVV